MQNTDRPLRFGQCRQRRCGALLLLAAWAPTLTLTAQGVAATAEVKAALVYNFLKFTEWPGEAASDPLVLCVVNPDRRTEAAFAAVHGRAIAQRPIQVRTLAAADSTTRCHLLYLHDGNARELQQLSAGQPALLTVGDRENFVDAGGAIGLVELDGRMQFKVNLDVMRRGSYKVSAQLLKLAINNR
ncbi:YfiR family protein [Rugamonas sp. CCM 8940]|uniref:YfiR family protein n=1 Tax=Rugamonas sp. CCM 8940 TaxID=2765359 RepID=UPI0018F60A40|nr:YfiR family protein [Rugamonas sp. CCM 8940]MBJ7310924.1 YfiR family protein [Rugamonas sp. CCM 8940]